MNQFVKIGGVFLGIVLLSIGLIFWLTAGEEDELQTIYADLLSDARRYNADGIISAIDMTYRYDDVDYKEITRLIKQHCREGEYVDIEERKAPSFSVQGKDVAMVETELNVYRSELGRRFAVPIWIRLRFEHKEGHWYVTGIDHQRR